MYAMDLEDTLPFIHYDYFLYHVVCGWVGRHAYRELHVHVAA